MATAQECQQALETLTGKILELDPADREAHLVNRDVSCHVTDLGVTFTTRIGPDGAAPVELANGSVRNAQIRLTTKSDDLVALAADPESFPRAWLTGKLKIQANVFDLLRLRKLL